ncbi:MAG: c-type cytochrome [Acidobacteriia bacterium]|nr:c-type cytochrome [Terriglobia bacterium]
MRTLAIALLASMTVGAADPIPGDARRGAGLFERNQCVVCHSVQGKGGNSAPDLAKRTGRAYTPSLLASLMWNHAPVMWPAMERAGIPKPSFDTQQASDLYAYLYAFRYFEPPGDAARGKLIWAAKGCSGCHGLTPSGATKGPPVTQWSALTDSIGMARAMWNHSPQMRQAMVAEKMAWPHFTSQEFTDLHVYLRSLPNRKPGEDEFSPDPAASGPEIFVAKGCPVCHQGSLAFANRFRNRTMTDLSVAMWNHGPMMQHVPPEISPVEMRRLVGYLWSLQYFEAAGDEKRGAKIYREKGCFQCHGAKPPKSPANSIAMVSVLWTHGPTMLEQMKAKNIPWPRFRGEEMSHLVAYLNK